MNEIQQVGDAALSLWIAETDAETFARRFTKKAVRVDTGCWLWRGYRNSWGYGVFYLGKNQDFRPVRAHRLSYTWFVGPIPEGLGLDHTCRQRACVNPAHLEPVTNKENVLRGEGLTAINARKKNCPLGHQYTKQNTYLHGGKRYCRICVRERSREWMRRARQRINDANNN